MHAQLRHKCLEHVCALCRLGSGIGRCQEGGDVP